MNLVIIKLEYTNITNFNHTKNTNVQKNVVGAEIKDSSYAIMKID